MGAVVKSSWPACADVPWSYAERESIVRAMSWAPAPLDLAKSTDGEAHVGDLAIVSGDVVRILDIMPPIYIGRGIPQRPIVQRLHSKAPAFIARFSHTLIPTKSGDGDGWYLRRAKRYVDTGEVRWLIDVHTGEMLRVATRYDVWLFDEIGADVSLDETRARFALVDGVSWMTGAV